MNHFMQASFAVATSLGYGKTIAQGAATTCHVAASPSLASTSGKFFEDCNAVTIGHGHMHDEAMAERLWDVSADMTTDYLLTHTGPDYNDYDRAVQDQRDGEQE